MARLIGYGGPCRACQRTLTDSGPFVINTRGPQYPFSAGLCPSVRPRRDSNAAASRVQHLASPATQSCDARSADASTQRSRTDRRALRSCGTLKPKQYLPYCGLVPKNTFRDAREMPRRAAPGAAAHGAPHTPLRPPACVRLLKGNCHLLVDSCYALTDDVYLCADAPGRIARRLLDSRKASATELFCKG